MSTWNERHDAAVAQLDREWMELGELIDKATLKAASICSEVRWSRTLNIGKRPQLASEVKQALIATWLKVAMELKASGYFRDTRYRDRARAACYALVAELGREVIAVEVAQRVESDAYKRTHSPM
jgi:hypothetical protein